MASSNHPSSAVLLDHANGSLAVAHDRVVTTHLLGCSTCQDAVRFLETVGNLLLAGSERVAPPPGLFDELLLSIDRTGAVGDGHGRAVEEARTRREVGGTVLPLSLEGLRPGRLRWLAPGIRHSTLWHDDRGTLHFIRVSAGVALPAHRHRGLELTCVLSGAFRDGDEGTRYTTGDVSEEDDADDSVPVRGRDHLVVAEPPEDCICIMATTGRLRFRGWMARLLQPVMPF